MPTAAAARLDGMPPPMADRAYRVAYLVTHPIQYQAPMLRLIAAQPDIDLTVFFQSDLSLGSYEDEGFGRAVKWDVPLLEGYRHEFLPGFWRQGPIGARKPLSFGLGRRLRRSRFDALWVHGYARITNLAAILCAKAHGLKVLVRDEATLFSADRSGTQRAAKRAFFAILSRLCDAYLAIGSANRDYYLSQGVPARRIFDMPYCVDNDFFARHAREAAARRQELRRELALADRRPVILYASKFEPRKRPQDLLDAYERALAAAGWAEPPYLLFVGDGELRAQLEASARARGLGGVRFLGFRNQGELPALYELSDVFVLPSVREPWGLVVNEAMAAGKAVIVSDRVGCAPDLVRNGVNGVVFPAGDVTALAEALRATAGDPERNARMGEESRKIIERWSFAEDVAGLRQALRASFS